MIGGGEPPPPHLQDRDMGMRAFCERLLALVFALSCSLVFRHRGPRGPL